MPTTPRRWRGLRLGSNRLGQPAGQHQQANHQRAAQQGKNAHKWEFWAPAAAAGGK